MKYKIDFNNGKVFEVRMCEEYYIIEEPDVNLTEEELISLGATITEIKEPIKFECDVEWKTINGNIVPFNDAVKGDGVKGFEQLSGKRGKLTFVEHEE